MLNNSAAIKKISFAILIFSCILIIQCNYSKNTGKIYRSLDQNMIAAQPFYKVELKDSFWLPRLNIQREVMLPFAFDKVQAAVDNLKKTADFLKGIEGELPFPHRYLSSDLYKIMEAAAHSLQYIKDPQLEAKMDSIISIIENAQQDDGYLYVAHITGVSKDHDHWGGGGMGDKPYSFVDHSHELYNMGHMYEAAIAYFRATGKSKWLNIAEKNADHINRVFFEGDPHYNDGIPVMQAPGHQEIELALVKLYQTTGKIQYLEMAKKFIEIRGVSHVPEGEKYLSPTYAQQHKAVKSQEKAVGHAVRAGYMYSAMADIDAMYGTNEYEFALRKIWRNIVDTKMPINGGLGAIRGIEGFGEEYELPNAEAYNETCAAIANVFFNYRLNILHGDAHYMDVAEIALYNNVLAGINLEGNRFFYVNPLEADGRNPFNQGETGRSPWFNTACCPSNIARIIPQVPGLMYAYRENEIYFNLFASGETEIPMGKEIVRINQKTNYPYDGNIYIQLDIPKAMSFKLFLRIPSWARSQFVPGFLYRYVRSEFEPWTITVNGLPYETNLHAGYTIVDKIWSPGDVINLHLPMPVRFNRCLDSVETNRNKLAVTYGPLLYCAEEIDNDPGFFNFNISADIPGFNIKLENIEDGILRDIPKINITCFENGQNKTLNQELNLIPYFAWNNRGNGSMKVWFNRK